MRVVSIDFDNTIYDENSDEILNLNFVNEYYESPDNFVVIYTARSYSQFEWIRKTLLKNGIKFHAIVCEKIRSDVYIDDKNMGGLKWF
jgi:hypothetical protein